MEYSVNSVIKKIIMSKTTITICGEECVILPAPKGAFLKIDGVIYPDFVPFVAVNPIIKKIMDGILFICMHLNTTMMDI